MWSTLYDAYYQSLIVALSFFTSSRVPTPPGNRGNTREFDNYVKAPGNTLELKKIHGKPGKLFEFQHFIPSIAKSQTTQATAKHFLRNETMLVHKSWQNLLGIAAYVLR